MEPASPIPTFSHQRGRGNSSFCPHIIGQVRLQVYRGVVAHARGTDWV
jgi:hypothetical protein